VPVYSRPVICVYEDEGVGRLPPLCDLRPAFDLRCGRFTLLEKLQRLYRGQEFHLWVRDELAEVTADAHPDCRVNKPVRKGRLFLSARVILDEPVSPEGRESVLLAGDRVVGFRVCAECAEQLSSVTGLRAELAEEQVKARFIEWPWDIIEQNAAELRRESREQRAGSRPGGLPRGVTVVGPGELLCVARDTRLWPGVVVSTETGPVFIDRGAVVRPGSFIEGPCYVGPGTVIDDARVRPGCSFGPHCRIGGEVEASVFQGFANKHHDGFIGHSFVGEWANLGALTTNSDLKNAYQPVQVFYDGKPVDSGLLKVGCFIGDHVKTAIGTLLNTGTRVGTFANWFEPGLSPKEIPAFAWGARARWPVEVAVENARQVMGRRGVTMSPAYERQLRTLFRSQKSHKEH
jgi:UDP-N-acetylglucosamine diphosphorylase/glucosamine-1-phosphate N-acetyltransferase